MWCFVVYWSWVLVLYEISDFGKFGLLVEFVVFVGLGELWNRS